MKKLKITLIFISIVFIVYIIKNIFFGSRISEEQQMNLALSIDRAIEGCLKVYDIQDSWIRRSIITRKDSDINKNVKLIRIPKDLPFSILNLAITKSVSDSGGKIFTGEEVSKSNSLIISAGYDDIVIDSLVLIKDGKLTYKKGKIALIIDDFGNDNSEVIKEYLRFPEKITFAVIPGNKYSKEIGKFAFENGFEVIIHLPMESDQPQEKGESIVLKGKMDRKNVENIINLSIKELPMARGVSNHMGSKTTEDAVLMKLLADVLKRKGFYFIDCLTSNKSKAFEVFKKSKMRVLKRDVFLDNEENESVILSQLNELMKIAKENGKAVGIGHSTKGITLKILQGEIPKMYKKGFEFVFASEIL